jgi:hypothetical protein
MQAFPLMAWLWFCLGIGQQASLLHRPGGEEAASKAEI